MPVNQEIVDDIFNEATANYEGWGVTQKRAIELVITKYVMYTKFGMDIDISANSEEIYALDGSYDGGCDHYWYDDSNNHLILVQLKTSHIDADGNWNPGYDMSYEEQTKLANIFARQVKDGNHGSYIADLGQGIRFDSLTARFLELHEIMNNPATTVTICNIVTGTLGGNSQQIQADIEGQGFQHVPLDWIEIQECWKNFVMMTNTGGAVPHIDIIMPKEYCSFSSKVVGIEQKTDNELIQILEGVNVQLSGDEVRETLIELVHRNTANNLLGFTTGKSIYDAVREFGMALTLGNLRHFVGFSRSGSSSNDGMKDTLENHPQFFHERNNGLRITCNGMKISTNDSGNFVVRLNSPQIVNGGQTSWVLTKHGTTPEKIQSLEDEVKVLIFAIDVSENPDGGMIIAKASNTQTALDKWAFHANSETQRLLLQRFSNTYFEVCGNQKSFFYAIKTGEYDRLNDEQKSRHSVPNVTNGKYQITPQDVGKMILCLRGESYSAYQQTPLFSKFENEDGLYEHIFEIEVPNIESIIYARVVWESVVNLNKELKILAANAGNQDMWSYAKEAVTASYFKVMKRAHGIETNQQLYDLIRDTYFPTINWNVDEQTGKKLNQLTENRLNELFGVNQSATYTALYPQLLAVHRNHEWQEGEASQQYFKKSGFQNDFTETFANHFVNMNQMLTANGVNHFRNIFEIQDDDNNQ
jgi:antitoxin component of RelBE/YafQ-DinJ toxin-antitoxin module